MDKNCLGLKYGRVRNAWLSDEFQAENAVLWKVLNEHIDKMIDGGWSPLHNKDKFEAMTLDEKNEITEELCRILDIFFDKGVEIYNEWHCRMHTTKESYRAYLFDYNAPEPHFIPDGMAQQEAIDIDTLPF